MYKERSQVIRFCDVCTSLVCFLVISLAEDREKESLYSTPLTQFHPNGAMLTSKEKLYHSVVWYFLQHSIDIAQAQCVPVLSPLHIGEGYLEIIEQ